MEKRSMFGRWLDRFSKAKILVIGDIMMDRFIWGKVSRISPEAPVPVVVVDKETFLLGGAANVVNNIHSLGGKVSLCGVLGDDETGQRLLEELTGIGVGVHGIFVEPGRQTTTKTRIIAHHQQVVRIDRETADHLKASTLKHLSEFLKKNIRHFDGVVLSDYGKGLLTRALIHTSIREARERKKFVLVDPKPKNVFFCKRATVITPNTTEASAASGIPITDLPSLKKAGKMLLSKLQCDVLVITRGEEGMAIFESRQDPFLVPTVAKEVYDVTGAGDTVIGTMALALATGAGFRNAARLANYAAGVVVGKMGTATVSPEELAEVIREKM
jgi:D-beta-D-heptose 7-phosphate kinase/D-beta-D-heptose 1-phosphate adenosyltransferase